VLLPLSRAGRIAKMQSRVDESWVDDALPVRIVLVETSHPGNVGATARAMKNMALDRLWLVSPASFPSAEASARASGAADLLHSAKVCTTLAEALEGCGFVVGASARQRSLAWPTRTPRECAGKIVEEAASGEVAVVFGRENSGLRNDELQRCHAHVQIPTNPGYSSLNLAMAVQVIAYEIMMARAGSSVPTRCRETPLATAEDIELFFQHLERVLVGVQFLDPSNPRHLMMRLRRMFARAELDRNEVAILRGILAALVPGSGKQPRNNAKEESQ
jgi:tRNA (cytidine32/uridine32-2'-O)-methyltransferase